MKKENEICECGHKRKQHIKAPRINYERCGVNLCKCKKFKLKK